MRNNWQSVDSRTYCTMRCDICARRTNTNSAFSNGLGITACSDCAEKKEVEMTVQKHSPIKLQKEERKYRYETPVCLSLEVYTGVRLGDEYHLQPNKKERLILSLTAGQLGAIARLYLNEIASEVNPKDKDVFESAMDRARLL